MDYKSEFDVVVVGAGPAGLACAVELAYANYDYVVVEKGCLVNSLCRFPTYMVFYTTPERLEIGNLPFVCQGEKPLRIEALKYFRRLSESYRLNITTFEKVVDVVGVDGDFMVATRRMDDDSERRYRCRKVILAVGSYDNPNPLDVPGEQLPKVSHYFTEAHPHHGREVVVVGGGNSAAEAALDLFRAGARVTLVHRRSEMGSQLKYWIAPDLNNRIREGSIRALFRTRLVEIRPGSVRARNLVSGEEHEIPNDFVFALTGYHPDCAWLRHLGIEIDEEALRPRSDPETLETNVKGLYLAGVVTAGRDSNSVFIENARLHGRRIVSSYQRDSVSRAATISDEDVPF